MEVGKSPSLVLHPHPLIGDGSVTVVDAFRSRETLGAYIKRTGVIVPSGPVVVWHNGMEVPNELWRHLIPRTGDLVIIRTRVLGGGGDGSKVLRTAAMIALVVVASWAAGAYGAAFASAIGVSTATGAALISAGIMIGGSLLINALLPPPSATASALGANSKYESSPTYAISGGRNRQRLWEPMALVFGRHKIVPDLAALPYTEYVGDDQYLNQAFHFGLQADNVALSDFKIGDTPITNYQGVQLQQSGSDGKLSMFPGNVDTIAGFALNQPDGFNSRTTGLDVTYISVELAAQLFYVRDDGGMDGRTVDVQIQYRPVGGAWIDIGLLQDAVYATHYWSLVDNNTGVQIAYGSANAGGHYDGQQDIRYVMGWDYSGDQATQTLVPLYSTWRWAVHPYQLGQPWQGQAPDPLLGYSSTPGVRMYGARQEATRRTIGWSVAAGQYEVRIAKTTGDIANSRESNQTAVNQILAYQTDPADYTGQLRVAVRIKATAQLSGAIDEFSAIGQAYCSTWNGSAWVWAATSNPAWWYLWFATGKYDPVSGNRVYGAGLPSDQIDIEAIKAWGLWCDQKGLTFDYVLDQKKSSAEVLQLIARAGRASPTWQTGKLGVVWDAADLPVVAMFGPFNIKAGSFKIDYINDGTADEIVLNFINPARNWAMDEVRVAVPGATTTNNPLQLDFDGCTSPAMAGREANLLAASQVWHRRRVSWETDIEGWVANRGAVVQMSHDLTVWGYSGRLIGRAGNVITLDKSVPSGGSGTLMIRGPENQMRVVSISSASGDVDTMTITADMTGFPLPADTGYEEIVPMDWAWFFDPLETPGRRFKITEVTPSEDGVKFSAIDDDPGYYASENNPYAYTPPRDGLLLGGLVFGITFNETIVNVAADITSVQVGWALSASMPVSVAVSVNGIGRPSMTTDGRSIAIQAQTGDTVKVTVTPKPASGSGTPSSQTYVVKGLTAPLPTLTGLTNVFRDGLTVLHWDRVTDIRQPDYEVRGGESWSNSRTVGMVSDNEMLAVGNGLYWVAAHFASRGFAVYGEPDSLQISGASLVRNVLITVDESPAWPGAVSDGAVVLEGELTLNGAGDLLTAADLLTATDLLLYGGAKPSGVYQSAQIIDVGFVAPVRLDFDLHVRGVNYGVDLLASDDLLAMSDLLGDNNAQIYRVTPQYRFAGEDGIYSSWANYTPGLINGRYFQVRALIETSDPIIVPYVDNLKWTVDVPDMIDRAENMNVPLAGVSVAYDRAFHAVPNLQITWLDALDGDRYVLTNQSETGFDIQFFNGATPVSRVMNRLSQGY